MVREIGLVKARREGSTTSFWDIKVRKIGGTKKKRRRIVTFERLN